MPDLSQLILLFILALVIMVAVWFARGWWDNRRATVLPRLIDAAQLLLAEIATLSAKQTDPQAAAQAAIDKATLDAKLTALRASVSKVATPVS